MKLSDLKGKHILSGIETGMKKVGFYEEGNYVKFCLDGVNYMAVEDPDDGYRSYLGDLVVSDTLCRFPIPDTEVLATIRETNHYSEDCDVLVLTDCKTGGVVLEVGTENVRDYYPYCVMEWTPENLWCNKRKDDDQMTKKEALSLQSKCEGYFNGLAGLRDVEISMVLTGKLKLSFMDGYITFTPDGKVDYVQFRGFYYELEEIKAAIIAVCNKWSDDLRQLLWSYEHIKELKDGGET